MANQVTFSQDRFIKFNLIPPLSEEEIEVIVKRDNSIIYSFLFVFLGIFFYFVLSLVQLFLLEPRVESLNNRVSDRDRQITNMSSIIQLNGELITKGNSLLKPILANDIKLKKIIDISNEVAGESKVLDYTLEKRSGEMVLSLSVRDYMSAIRLYQNAKEFVELDNVYIRNLVKNENDYTLTLSFLISA